MSQRATLSISGIPSRDPEGDRCTYYWRITAKPPESRPLISSPGAITTTFSSDVPGQYELALVVDDGEFKSLPAFHQVIVTER